MALVTGVIFNYTLLDSLSLKMLTEIALKYLRMRALSRLACAT